MTATVFRWVSVCALALAAGCATAPRTVFVAPDGNDANPGTKARPFATVSRAQERVRALRSEPPAGPVTVFLRGGVYELRAPLAFGPEDSGTAEAPVTYASYPGERAVVSGGKRLTGTWRTVPGKPYWQLAVPEARGGAWTFHLLTVNGESRTRARTPNWGEKPLRAEGREPGGDPRQALRYYPGDVNPAWKNPTDIDVVLLGSWTPTIHRVCEIVPERRAVRFTSTHFRAVDAWEPHFRYYLSNVFEALDQPGEWYLDRPTGTLYYYPMPGEDLAKAEVVAPVVKSRLVTFAGDPDKGRFVEHLRFCELTFRDVDGDMDRYNGVYRQGHMYLDSAFSARGLRAASFERCEFSHLGEYAMELADGCREVTVRQCHFWDLGAGALQIGVTDLGTLKANEAARAVRGVTVDNTCIHRLGTVWHGCYGIVNRFASETRITHNDIFDTHWDAIGLDARWNWKGETYSHGNVVAYNHLHHLGLRYQTDAGAVYQFGPLDTHIHHNLIHDTVAYPYICGFTGVYLDEQSRGAVVENNLVYNTDWYAYFQHKGMDNIFRNNIGAFARDGFLWRGSLNAEWTSNYLESCRNIYISSNDVVVAQGWEPGLKPPSLHDNLYYSLATNAPSFAGRSFADWQAKGLDTGSMLADPGCRAPASFDFALGGDAPAVRLVGFVPFDAELRTAGLYGDAAWRGLPQRYAARTPSATWTPEELARLATFELDFNTLKNGDGPGVFQCSEQKGAGFAVTDEVPGTHGPKCLKGTDRKGLAKAFYPYMHLSPRGLKEGRVAFSFAARRPAQAAAPFVVEFRGRGATGPEQTGPSIVFAADGSVKANGQAVGTWVADAWTRYDVAFELGAKNSGRYTLTVRGPAGETTRTVAFGSAAFSNVSWLGVTAPGDADGAFYLDDLSLSLGKQP